MYQQTRAMLDNIDRFLSDPTIAEVEKRGLWDVLTALRGPDFVKSSAQGAKKMATANIRTKALPRTSKLGRRAKAKFGSNLQYVYGAHFSVVPKRVRLTGLGSGYQEKHWAEHIEKANTALGL